jgi:hypothetical protein
VDDILIAGKDMAIINNIKNSLSSIFDVRDLGEAAFFLGMEIRRNRDNRSLSLSRKHKQHALYWRSTA